MTDLTISIYIASVIVSIVVYIFVVLRICKSENISLGEAFGFTKGDRESKPKTRNKKVSSNSFSVKEQIKQLENELYATDDGDERKRLLDEIRKLEQQK